MGKTLTFKEKLVVFMKKTKKQNIKFVSLGLLVAIVLLYSYNYVDSVYLSGRNEALEVFKQADDTVFSAAMVGDMMFGLYIEDVAAKQNYSHFFDKVNKYLQACDYVTGNYENPVVLGNEYEKADKKIHLSADSKSIECLKDMNFKVVNLANNHMLDYGIQGLEDTIKVCIENMIDFVGAGDNLPDAKKIDYQTIRGIRVATLGFSDIKPEGFSALKERGGILTANPAYYTEMIKEAKMNANMVIVHVHWGVEYSKKVSDQQRKIAREMVDAGADIIVGHHPHVLEPVEIYKNSLILYSMGNFIFDQGWSVTKESAMAIYSIGRNGNAKVELLPVWIGDGQPELLMSNLNVYRRNKILKTLTKELGNNKDWTIQDGKLVINLDQPHIAKGMVLSEN